MEYQINDVDEFAKVVKTEREKLEITQKELAERAKVSAQTISAIEKGRMEPSLRIMSLIAIGLGIALVIGAFNKSK